MAGLYDIDIEGLIDFAKDYCKLGWAVQEQLDQLIVGDTEDINPNAVKLIKEKLGDLNLELDDCIAGYEAEQ